MEVTDLVMLILTEKISNSNINAKTVYNYDTKRIWIGNKDYVEVYSRGQNMDWLGVGATNYRITENVSVVVRCKTKEGYMNLRELIKSVFTGNVFEFVADDSGIPLYLEEGDDFDEIEFWGVYVVRVHLLKDPNIYDFQRGEKIEMHMGNGTIYDGWVYGVIGEDLFIIMKKSIMCLIRPVRINEESDTVRKMFKATFDIEGTLIECVVD